MKILEGPVKGQRRIAIYAHTKSRKTNLATSLPWGEYGWGEKAIYVADDPGSERLDSVLEHNRGRLVIVAPSDPDPRKEAIEIATRNWAQTFPGVGTLIWDTFTERTERILYHLADTGAFNDAKHVSVGEKGKAEYLAQPMPGDFGMTHGAIWRTFDFLFRQPLNLILVFHADLADKETSPVYGPKTVGTAIISEIGKRFPALLRMEAVSGQGGIGKAAGPTQYKVHMQQEGRWLAGVWGTKAIPAFTLGDDPVEFWRYLEQQTT